MAYRETGRTTQRHRALDVVFEADERGLLYPEDLLDLLTERRSLSTAQVPIGEFGVKIVEAFADESYNVDTLIEAASEDWSLDRMNVVDRTILRLGTTELLVMGTPRSAVVAEWAHLARKLSTERSVGFVMGVLNKVADIRARELAANASDPVEARPSEATDVPSAVEAAEPVATTDGPVSSEIDVLEPSAPDSSTE